MTNATEAGARNPNGDTVSTSAPAQPLRKRRPTQPVGLSLRYKIFLAVLALLVLIISSMVVLVQWKATRVTRRSVDAAMRNTGRTFSVFLTARFNQVKSDVKQLADDPNLTAAIAETGADHVTVADSLEAKRIEIFSKADYIMAVDSMAMLIARTDDPTKSGTDLSESPLLAIPLEGDQAWGIGSRKGKLSLMASAPVTQGTSTIVGALAMSYPIDSGFAADAKSVTNADATFLVETGNQLAPASSTLTAESGEMLSTALAANPQITAASMGEGKTVGPVEITLGGEPNIVIAVPLTSASGERLGLFVASRSLYQEMSNYRQIRDALIYIGIAAVLLAFAISFFMARRITRPIAALVEVTEQVIEGDLNVEMPAVPNDEVGILARSFAKMLVELRQKAEMEEYLRNLKAQVAGSSTLSQAARISTSSATQPSTSSALAIGGVFNNRYVIEQILGSGAMGTVYKAKDRELDEEVAIKTVKADALKSDPTAVDRFKQEIKLARRITDKHVLRTYDLGEIDGTLYITMEYMKAVTLKYILEQRKALPLGPGLHLAKQICLGLAAAHEQGIVHRDIKPQNMLVSSKGELKLMDFGIARLQGKGGMTQTGLVIGTPDYMSPEQASGLTLDARSDIYSAGVVFYEMFCGLLPYTADTVLAVMLKHIQEPPRPPREANPALPAALEQVILKMLAKQPDARYAKVTEVSEALANVAMKH
ncbi:MAG: protein kinase [Acidobacteria bacterium]|nr:protein kinase [Acidobacteriota bacterium]